MVHGEKDAPEPKMSIEKLEMRRPISIIVDKTGESNPREVNSNDKSRDSYQNERQTCPKGR